MRKEKILILILTIFTLLAVLTACQAEPESTYVYYTVTFDSQGGSALDSVQVHEGNTVPRPALPQRAGYTHNGWYRTAQTTEENRWDFEVDRVTADLVLYAGWTEVEHQEPTQSLEFEQVTGGYAVTGVGDETAIIIPSQYNGSNVVAIGELAFNGKQIVSVIIPDTVTEIGLNAFTNCQYLTTVSIGQDSALTAIANNAFSGNDSLTSFYFPKGLTVLGDSVFNNCGSIERFTVSPENTVFAAQNGHLVEKATATIIRGSNNSVVPEGVITIGTAAFRRTKATLIEIPSSVVTIQNYVFDDAYSLEKIEVSQENENFASLSGILYNKTMTEILHVPQSIRGNITLASTITQIPMYAFDARQNIALVHISQTLQRISFGAFRDTTLTISFEGNQSQWEEIIANSNIMWGGDGLTVTYEQTAPLPDSSNGILVVYFSRTQNTKTIAEFIATATGGDLVEIVPATPYVTDYSALSAVARTELNNNARPPIDESTTNAIDISKYSTVLIGYPIWHGYEPMIIRTFVEAYQKLANKTVYTFSTSGSSGGQNAFNSIRALCSTADVQGYRNFTRTQLSNAQATVTSWIETLQLSATHNASVEGMRIKMSFGQNQVFVILVDGTASRDLVSRLAVQDITLSFSDYAGTEKIAYPSDPLEKSAASSCNPSVGDVTIYKPWNNIAIFYDDTVGESSSLELIGRIEDNGIQLLAEQTGNFDVVIQLVK